MGRMIFNTNDLEDHFITMLRDGKFDRYNTTEGRFEIAVAVLEYDWLDIELNLQMASDPDGDGYINQIEPDYFVCAKGIHRMNAGDAWVECGYVDEVGLKPEVDWNSDEWREILLADMVNKLARYAEITGLKFDAPNFTGNEERKELEDMFMEARGIG